MTVGLLFLNGLRPLKTKFGGDRVLGHGVGTYMGSVEIFVFKCPNLTLL